MSGTRGKAGKAGKVPAGRRGSSTRYKSSSGPARDNGPLFTRRPSDYANGDKECQALKKRIDQSICVVQSSRKPELCAGCKYEAKS